MLIWLMMGAEADVETGGPVEPEAELLAAGFRELPLEVGLNALPAEGAAEKRFPLDFLGSSEPVTSVVIFSFFLPI